MAEVILKKVEKQYPNGFKAVHGIDLDIKDGEFMVFVGPSGCAKSTTLRMIAGLEEITGGEIWIGDKLVNDLPPKDRGIAMVFQNYALYPHMTVYDNMAFYLFSHLFWKYNMLTISKYKDYSIFIFFHYTINKVHRWRSYKSCYEFVCWFVV